MHLHSQIFSEKGKETRNTLHSTSTCQEFLFPCASHYFIHSKELTTWVSRINTLFPPDFSMTLQASQQLSTKASRVTLECCDRTIRWHGTQPLLFMSQQWQQMWIEPTSQSAQPEKDLTLTPPSTATDRKWQQTPQEELWLCSSLPSLGSWAHQKSLAKRRTEELWTGRWMKWDGWCVQIESQGMSVMSLRKTFTWLPPFKKPETGAEDMAGLSECLSRMHEALGSVPRAI